jgi:hypothetical protein
MKHPLIAALTLAVLASFPVHLTAGELEGEVKVSGREVTVRLQNRAGQPVAGVEVRVLFARKRVVAVGHTDQDGRWVCTAERTGMYEATAASGANTLRLLFLVLDTPQPPPIPWGLVIGGAGCLLGALGLCFVRVRHRMLLRGALLGAGLGLLGLSAWRHWLEPHAPAAPPDFDVASSARKFLSDREVRPLSEPLARLLTEPAEGRVETQPHALLGKTAPDFELGDANGQRVRLRERLEHGPVVLVFYYGYYCNHYVGQLFALHDDIARFRELGAEVIAVSADPPELTRLR